MFEKVMLEKESFIHNFVNFRYPPITPKLSHLLNRFVPLYLGRKYGEEIPSKFLPNL